MLIDASFIPREPARIMPGVVHLPAFLLLDEQRALVEQVRDIARSVAGTPVAMRRPMVGKGQMSAHIMSLGWFWATNPYRLVREVDGHPVPPVPENIQALGKRVLAAAQECDGEVGSSISVETALVNYYPPGTGMGMHVDGEEESESAVVSLSMGDEAVFRIEGHDVLLMSGDAVVFGGPARRARHGVVTVREGTGPEGTSLKQGRINLTLRQVMD